VAAQRALVSRLTSRREADTIDFSSRSAAADVEDRPHGRVTEAVGADLRVLTLRDEQRHLRAPECVSCTSRLAFSRAGFQTRRVHTVRRISPPVLGTSSCQVSSLPIE